MPTITFSSPAQLVARVDLSDGELQATVIDAGDGRVEVQLGTDQVGALLAGALANVHALLISADAQLARLAAGGRP